MDGTDRVDDYILVDKNDSLKRAIKRFFCRHDWFTEWHIEKHQSPKVCKKCGKVLKTAGEL